MKFRRICASISVTITDIWTKFCTEHKYRTITTPEWSNSHKMKIKDSGGCHLEFRENVNNFDLHKDILHQIIWEDGPRPCGDDHVINSRNRKLIYVTSSNESLKHVCVDLSDYNIYLNQIWHRTQIPYYQHAGTVKFIKKLKIQVGGGRHLEFQRNVNKSGLDTDVYTKFYGKMYHGHSEMTSWPKFETGN